MSDELSPPRLLRGLRTSHLGWPLEVHAACPSTNDRALELLVSGAPHGTLVVADEQTRGRGQRGRAWHSPAGLALHASLVLRAERGVPTLLVAAVGLGLAEGLEEASGLGIGIKWPNDLWIGERKLSGVLVEARGFRTERSAFVAGFGVNVNQRREDFPPELRECATSLALAAGRRFDRGEVLRTLLAALEVRVDQALGGTATADLHQAYRARSVLLGRRVSLLDGDRPLAGVVVDLGATDGLLLRTDDGRLLHVLAEHAREVRPLPL